MKKILLGAGGLVLTSLLVVGAWIIYAETTSDLIITSTDTTPLSFTTTLGSESIDATSFTQNTTFNYTATLNNLNGDLNMKIAATNDITDVVDDCTNTDDVSSIVYFDDIAMPDWEVENGGHIETITSGDHKIKISYTIVPQSCPQSVERIVTVSEV